MRQKKLWLSYCKRTYLYLLILLCLLYLWQDKTLLYDLAADITFVGQWIHERFNLIGNFENDGSVWIPSILIILSAILGILIYPKPPRPLRVGILLVLASSHTLYIIFRTFNTLCFDTIGNTITTVFLWISELVIYLSSISLYLQLMFPINRTHETNIYAKKVIGGEYSPWVDIFVPTCSEPIEVVRRTIIGCQAIEYQNKRVYILDDGNRREMEKLAGELNCCYITRTKNIHAKAGNINNAISQTKGELIAIFDADCVPLKNFLIRTAGFFQQPQTALVTTAQAFYNKDEFRHNVMSLMEQSRFFHHTQRGRDKFNALLCFGTCFIIRRTAIEKIGGIPTETLSEDWAISIKLQAAGYKTYMVDETLGAGAIAESMGEYLRQRMRWTQGTLQSLFASTNPLRIKGLSFTQRLIHAYSILHYLANPFYVFIIIVPLLYFFFGFIPFYITRGQFWFFFMPFICLNILTFSWICREYTSRLSSFISESFMGIPLSIVVIKTLIRPFGWKFRVTRKGIYRSTINMNWSLGTPLLLTFLLLSIGIIYGYRIMTWYDSAEMFYLLFFWTLLRLICIWIGIYAASDLPQQRKSVRFPHKLTGSFTNETSIKGTTIDISETGILLYCDKKITDINLNSSGAVSICDIGLFQIPARLVCVHKQHLAAIAFENMPLEEYRRLIEFLYCRPNQWDTPDNIDKKVLQAVTTALTLNNLFRQNKRQNINPDKEKIYV